MYTFIDKSEKKSKTFYLLLKEIVLFLTKFKVRI